MTDVPSAGTAKVAVRAVGVGSAEHCRPATGERRNIISGDAKFLWLLACGARRDRAVVVDRGCRRAKARSVERRRTTRRGRGESRGLISLGCHHRRCQSRVEHALTLRSEQCGCIARVGRLCEGWCPRLFVVRDNVNACSLRFNRAGFLHDSLLDDRRASPFVQWCVEVRAHACVTRGRALLFPVASSGVGCILSTKVECCTVRVYNRYSDASRLFTRQSMTSVWPPTLRAKLIILFFLLEHICHGRLWRPSAGEVEGHHDRRTLGSPM